MFLARVPELDFVSQGYTPEDARKNLLDKDSADSDSGVTP